MARVITRSFADVIEQLELDGDTVVTTERLAAVMRHFDVTGEPRRLAYELQRDGWLGRLRTRNAWEFLPGARGGPYGAGDRFIEFRAQRGVDPTWRGVLAMESAASILGLAQRIPEHEVVALPGSEPFPKALAGDWRYVRIDMSDEAITTVNGLPTWDQEGLLVGIAIRPSAYKDLAGLGQWMETATHQFDIPKMVDLLETRGAGVRQRAAYLLAASGHDSAARSIIASYPPAETAWLGPRQPGGRFDPMTKVNDTLLSDYFSVGPGGDRSPAARPGAG